MDQLVDQSERAPATEERALAQSGARIDHLLGELQELVSGPAWQRIEEVVREMLALHGAGLGRVLASATKSGADPARFQRALCDDPVVSSLLLVHGLHPVAFAERVQQALERVRPYLGSHAGDIELTGITPEGVVRLKMLGSCDGCPSSAATLEHTVRRAIEDAAPEVVRIEVEGAKPAQPEEPLVTLRTGKTS